MSIKVVGLNFDEVVNRHAKLGWQCPECYGIQIETRRVRHSDHVIGFQCNECGCNWSKEQCK
jgi:hypothetical protein